MPELKPQDTQSIEQVYHEEFAELFLDYSSSHSSSEEPTGSWTKITPIAAPIPPSGWKLHISSCERDALGTLRACLPAILDSGFHFKFCRNERKLAKLNSGEGGATQIGKFITVYCDDDNRAVALAKFLDTATSNFAGPPVPTDRRLGPKSRVSYRYGAFLPVVKRTPTGEILDFYEDKAGLLVADLRSTPYVPPKNIEDPFSSTGLVEEYDEPTMIIHDRYLILEVVTTSKIKRVMICFDLETRKTVVLKEASLEDEFGMPGMEPRDIAKLEYENLLMLGHSLHFPTAYDLFECSGRIYLPIEYVSGTTLDQYVVGQYLENCYIDVQEILETFIRICNVVQALHSIGRVHADIKSSNIMLIDGGEVVLIDLELCRKVGQDIPPRVGTRGYRSDNRINGGSAQFDDDIYALGCVLYFLCTGAEPSLAPSNKPLTDRPIQSLNRGIPVWLSDYVAWILNGNAKCIADLLSELEEARKNCQDPSVAARRKNKAFESTNFRELAQLLGNRVEKLAVRRSGRLTWDVKARTAREIDLKDINSGSAGTMLALCKLQEVCPSAQLKELIFDCSNTLALSTPADMQIPGLYVGESGAAVSLLKAALVLGSPNIYENARRKLESSLSLDVESPDLFNGRAGLLRAALMFHAVSGCSETLELAKSQAELIITASETKETGRFWTIPEGHGGMSTKSFYGYSHGAAGIGDCLIDLYDVTLDEGLKQTIFETACYLEQASKRIGKENSGLSWPSSEGSNQTPAFWCHGAAGIAKFFLRLVERDLYKNADKISAAALWSVSNTIRWARPTLCHGLAGGIHSLIDGAKILGDETLELEAKELAEIMRAFSRVEAEGMWWETETYCSSTCEYMVGSAGLIPTLLRLDDSSAAEPMTVADYKGHDSLFLS